MPGAVATQNSPMTTLQGVAIPAQSVNPDKFFELTRRKISPEKSLSYGGGGVSQVVELRKSDILSTITLRFVGTLVVTPGAGSVASTYQWPLGIAGVRFTANGQSNLINTGPAGLKHLRARDLMKKADLTDRSVVQTIGGTSRSNGTMALGSESWGVGSQTSAIAGGTYNVDLTFTIPVSEDEVGLIGAIFLQTASSDLTLSIDETPLSQLFTAAGGATVALTGTWQVSTTKFAIPTVDGGIVVPNLSLFHSIIGSRVGSSIAQGENELRVIGQGAGKSLLRIYGHLINGATPAPVAMTAANFGPLAYRFGNNEQPDTFLDGSSMRADMERRYNSDFAALWGYWCHDFAHENTFRDVLNMGTTAELRQIINVTSAVTLVNPAVEYVAETVFLAGQAA